MISILIICCNETCREYERKRLLKNSPELAEPGRRFTFENDRYSVTLITQGQMEISARSQLYHKVYLCPHVVLNTYQTDLLRGRPIVPDIISGIPDDITGVTP